MTVTEKRPAEQARIARRRADRGAGRRRSAIVSRAGGDLPALLVLGAVLAGLLLAVARVPAREVAFSLDAPPPEVILHQFYGPERNDRFAFRWAKPQAALTIPVDIPATYRVTLTLANNPAAGSPQSVTLRVNDGAARTVPLDGGLREHTVEGHADLIDRRAGNRPVLTVALGTATFVPSDDPRPLGVIVARVAVAPAGSPSRWQPELLLPPLLLLLAGYGGARGAGARPAAAAGICGLFLGAFALLALSDRDAALALAYRPVTQPLWFLSTLFSLAVLPLAARVWSRQAPAQRREIILALLLLLCYGFFQQNPGWNELSRYDLVRALVDDRTTSIDRYHGNTGDKAFYQGRYYSDKTPGSALLAAPAYALLGGVSALAGAGRPEPGTVLHLLAFTAAGIPTVLLALLLLRFLRSLVGERWALAIVAGYALGTIALPFATMFFGHAASACFVFAAFYLLWRHACDGSPRGRGGTGSNGDDEIVTAFRIRLTNLRPLGAGFLAGWAVLTEFPAILGVGLLLLYALSRERRASLLMVAGALPPALLLLGYNWVSFDSPFALGYANLADNAFAGMKQGIFGVTLPKPAVLGELMVGPRGLLRLSPWLVLAPLGLWAARRPEARREVALCGAIVLAFLLYNAGYYLPFGGLTPGPRFLLPALPFAAVLVALAPRIVRPLTGLLLAVAVPLCAVATATGPLLGDDVADPLGGVWLPRLFATRLSPTTAGQRWGLEGGWPLAILGFAIVATAAALYATTRPRPAARRLASALTFLLAVLVLNYSAPLDLSARDSWDTGDRAPVIGYPPQMRRCMSTGGNQRG